MDESYFLFYEDLDWALHVKARGLNLGYASSSIVWHKRGTTTGSAKGPGEIPRPTVYLQFRNRVLFVRKYFPWTLPICIAVSLLYAVRMLKHRSPKNFKVALQGMLAGLRGEIGRPLNHLDGA
jgi:GT2 family glycosyltransferase